MRASTTDLLCNQYNPPSQVNMLHDIIEGHLHESFLLPLMHDSVFPQTTKHHEDILHPTVTETGHMPGGGRSNPHSSLK